MAFNYSELTRIKGTIESDTESLSKNLREFSSLINDNVNNSRVWKGQSASAFKEAWDEFEEGKFPEYKNHFKKEIKNVTDAIEAWSKSEE